MKLVHWKDSRAQFWPDEEEVLDPLSMYLQTGVIGQLPEYSPPVIDFEVEEEEIPEEGSLTPSPVYSAKSSPTTLTTFSISPLSFSPLSLPSPTELSEGSPEQLVSATPSRRPTRRKTLIKKEFLDQLTAGQIKRKSELLNDYIVFTDIDNIDYLHQSLSK